MALVVQKFGGTSLANVKMIRNVAYRVIDTYNCGDDLVVILSAMAGVTDSLIRLAYEASAFPDKRELDVLLTTGEQTTVSILAMMLKHMGYKAQSVMASQIGLLTDSSYGIANILDIDVRNMKKIIRDKTIPIIAGFQGCDRNGNITTLGRGGSDTSAVAIASALEADICEIYTDVDGIYTADPSVCCWAKKVSEISYDKMFQMANLGTKVLHNHSIGFAKKCNMPIHVRSSFSIDKGTMVIEGDSKESQSSVVGVTYDLSYARIKVEGIYHYSDFGMSILSPIEDSGILVDMVAEHVAIDGHKDFVFTVLREDFSRALDIEKFIGKSIGALRVYGSINNAKVSVVGTNVNDYANITSVMVEALEREKIDVIMINISETYISCIVREVDVKSAVMALHSAFALE